MIKSFGDRATSDLFNGLFTKKVKKIPNQIHNSAIRKLDMLNAAIELDDLKSPPGNRLEALQGDFLGFHSIRINIQWRIIFRWKASGAYEVQIIDYH